MLLELIDILDYSPRNMRRLPDVFTFISTFETPLQSSDNL